MDIKDVEGNRHTSSKEFLQSRHETLRVLEVLLGDPEVFEVIKHIVKPNRPKWVLLYEFICRYKTGF